MNSCPRQALFFLIRGAFLRHDARSAPTLIGGSRLKADDAKRLKELEKQNATLKRLLAEAELEKAALKELAEGNF